MTSTNWNGALAAATLISFVVGVLLAPLLLFLIRFSVRRFMRRRGRAGAPYVAPPPPLRKDAPPLHLHTAAAPPEPLHPHARALFARARRARYSAAALYLLAGIAAACVLAVADAVAADNPYLGPLGRLTLILNRAWPVVLTVSAVAIPSFRTKLIVLPLAAAVILAVTRVVAPDIVVTLIFTGPPTVLLLLVANRWLKTIGPVVALLAMVGSSALFLASETFVRVSGIVATVVFFLAIVAGLLTVKLLVRAYKRKQFSDLSFQLGFLWTVFSLWYVAVGAAGPVWWCGFAALGLYAVITRLTLPVLQRVARAHRPASLLVLRVFGAPGRSQRLFEEVGTRWRSVGPLHLIAGADSATANLDLAEAVRYLTFRFRSLYVSDGPDLQRRLDALDVAPDPDGRYRTNDFFCFEDTWKPTFTQLLVRSDAVLVDLSGYGPQNAGVAFELGHLLARRPLDSFVLMTDDATNANYLSATLTRLWRELDPSLPNARIQRPQLRVLHQSNPRHLVAALCDAAVAGGWRDEVRERETTGSLRRAGTTGSA